MKKTELKDFEEGILKGDTVIKESYPLEEKKLTVRYTLGTMTWRGDAYESAESTISYCCDDAMKNLKFGNNTIDPALFKKMIYQGAVISSCPFCGAGIEITEAK